MNTRRSHRTHATPHTLLRSSLLLALLIFCALSSSTALAQDKDKDNIIRKVGDRPGIIPDTKDKDKDDEPPKEDEKPLGPNDEELDIPTNFDPTLETKPPIPNQQTVKLDFDKVDLETVVKFFARLKKKNFIVSDSLKAGKKITIISDQKISVSEAYRAFLTALAMNGLTLIPHGKSFYKVVDANSSPKDTPPTKVGRAGLPDLDIMETRIIPIQHVSHQDVQSVLDKIRTKDSSIIPYAPTNTLIITEYAFHMKRMLKILSYLDQPTGADKIHIYQAQYADATQLAGKLTEIFDTQPASGSSSSKNRGKSSSQSDTDVQIRKIIADENTNQLIIIANKRSYRRILSMIEKLDVETNAGRIWVYSLQHAKSEDLASVLSGLAGQGSNNRTGSRNNSRTNRNSRNNSRNNSNNSSGGAALLSGDVQITAEPATNSLIITASFKDYLALKNVIEKLDQRRKQVYVEAVIMELSLDRNRRFGIGVNAGLPEEFDFIPQEAADEIGNTGLILGQANFESSQFLESIQGQGGLGFGIIGPSVSIPGTDFSLPAFLLFLQASQRDQDVNILSTPSILVLNNEEAEISVGERVPFFTGAGALGSLGGLGGLLGGSGASSAVGNLGGLGGLGGLGALGGLGGLGGGVDYQDVALTLTLTPQINASGTVKMDVSITVEELKPGAGDNLTPTTTKREAKTFVVANDQQTIVIGGLIRDVENEGVTKVPFLGDIPILGVLFRRNNTTIVKQNLVLMLTPYVIESQDDLDAITRQKHEQRRQFLELFGRKDKNYMANVNYARKHGLFESINKRVSSAIRDDRDRQTAYGDLVPDNSRTRKKTTNTPPPTNSPKDLIIIPEGSSAPPIAPANP